MLTVYGAVLPPCLMVFFCGWVIIPFFRCLSYVKSYQAALRFGHINSLRAKKRLKPGEEIFIHYGYKVNCRPFIFKEISLISAFAHKCNTGSLIHKGNGILDSHVFHQLLILVSV